MCTWAPARGVRRLLNLRLGVPRRGRSRHRHRLDRISGEFEECVVVGILILLTIIIVCDHQLSIWADDLGKTGFPGGAVCQVRSQDPLLHKWTEPKQP